MVQGTFYNAFFLLYVLSPRTARCVVGYFEEAAVISYNNVRLLNAGMSECARWTMRVPIKSNHHAGDNPSD